MCEHIHNRTHPMLSPCCWKRVVAAAAAAAQSTSLQMFIWIRNSIESNKFSALKAKLPFLLFRLFVAKKNFLQPIRSLFAFRTNARTAALVWYVSRGTKPFPWYSPSLFIHLFNMSMRNSVSIETHSSEHLKRVLLLVYCLASSVRALFTCDSRLLFVVSTSFATVHSVLLFVLPPKNCAQRNSIVFPHFEM